MLGLVWMMWITLLKTTQGVILLARALKNFSISIFIKVLPTSVLRILATQLATMMNGDGLARALKNFSISIFIKVLPTSVLRILATQLATMMNGDGG